MRFLATAALCFGLIFTSAFPSQATDRTPGVVTHGEFNHADVGMTRHRITHMYGTKGHVVAGYWWLNNNYYLYVQYPTATGSLTVAVFVDRGTTGNNWHLAFRQWYHRDGTVEIFPCLPKYGCGTYRVPDPQGFKECPECETLRRCLVKRGGTGLDLRYNNTET